MIETLMSLFRPDAGRLWSVAVNPWAWPLSVMLFGLLATEGGQKLRDTMQPAERKARKIHNQQNRQIVLEAAQAVNNIRAYKDRFPSE